MDSSLRELLGRLGPIRAADRVQCGSSAVFVLRLRPGQGVPKTINATLALVKRGMTMLLVEQNARAALALSHRGYVLANGVVTATGTGTELLADPSVQAAFLGHSARPPRPDKEVPCAS